MTRGVFAEGRLFYCVIRLVGVNPGGEAELFHVDLAQSQFWLARLLFGPKFGNGRMTRQH